MDPASRTQPNVVAFPPGLLPILFTYFHTTPDAITPQLLTLLTCALVNRTWHRAVLDFLLPELAHLDLQDFDVDSMTHLASLLGDSNHVAPFLVRTVRRVTIHVGTVYTARSDDDIKGQGEVESAVVELLAAVHPMTLVLDFSDVCSMADGRRSIPFLRTVATLASDVETVEVWNFGLFRYEAECDGWTFETRRRLDGWEEGVVGFAVDYNDPEYAADDPVATLLMDGMPRMREVLFVCCDIMDHALRALAEQRKGKVVSVTFEMCSGMEEKEKRRRVRWKKRLKTVRRWLKYLGVCGRDQV